VLKAKPSDPQVMAVAQNNVVALKGDRDLFDSFKKSKAATSEATEKKLTLQQKKAIAFNRALLLLHMNKPDQCTELLRSLEATYPGDELISLVRAAVLARQGKDFAKAEAALVEAVQSHRDAPRLNLSLAQLQMKGGNNKRAIETLQQTAALQHRPGWLSTMVALHEAEHDTAGAIAVVEETARYWQSQPSDGVAKEMVLREGAKYLLRRQRYEQAADLFEQLLALQKNDPEGIAGLVQACGHFDPERAEKYAERIPSLEGADEIDAEELELQTVEQANKGTGRRQEGGEVSAEDQEAENAAAAAAAAAADALAAKRRVLRQEKRKLTLEKRLPKALQGTDPSAWPPLDPERWLPKRDRSYYKPRRGKKKHEGKYGGHQGGAVSERLAKEYDRSEDTQTKEPEAEAPASPPPQQQQQNKKQENKQKKKRPKR